MTDEPDLPEVPDLTGLIDRLTAAHTVEVPDSDGITTAVRRPPLLRDLADARTASIVTCRACAHVWAGVDGARDLAAEITGKRRSA